MNNPTHAAHGVTLAWLPAACGMLLIGAARACAASAELPVPGSFQVIDRPSDDGSAVLVLWARPEEEVPGVRYAVEVAGSRADFESGRFKTQVVTSSPAALASAKPQYFGRSEKNERLYFAEVTPAALFPPPDSPKLTDERLKELAAAKVISETEFARALSAREDTRPDAQLSSREKAGRRWFQDLVAYLQTEARKTRESQKYAINRATYYFRLAAFDGDRKSYVTQEGTPAVVSGRARANLFKWGKLNNLIFSLLFGTVVLAFIHVARHRPNLFIRKIAGLEAVDEAIGRATEMDRPVFFVHGISDISDVATIAAVNILSQVARRTAEHDSRVRVTNIDPIVTAVSQEVVQQACTAAGRPDAYNADDVSLVASDQFSYVAAVSGMTVREQPGAIFFMGGFRAESLLLAETGASTGAIQVAGTDQYTQLPFFVTTCDYTLIGEELYAASAYLSRDPRLLGSLRGQDVGKLFLMIAIVGVSVALTAAAVFGVDLTWLKNLFVAR